MTGSVYFLGYVLSKDGVQIWSVSGWIKNNSNSTVAATFNHNSGRSFHGLASFYRHFIPHFSSTMAPITDYMNGTKFAWTRNAEAAFDLIKQKLTTVTLLVLLDFMQPFELHCDASKTY